MSTPVTLYRYGAGAWLWRILMLPALAVAVALLAGGILLAGALLAPALFFGVALATRIDLLPDGRIEVWTLSFWRRRLSPERLGPPRFRETAEGRSGSFYAPRLWVPVRGGLPIYLDLQGKIPDRRAFTSVIPVPSRALRSSSGR